MYSRIWFALQYSFAYLLCFSVNILIYLLSGKEILFRQNTVLCTVFVVFFMLIFSNEYLKRYVEFFDESIRFNSFRIGEARKVMSFNFRYENITSIESSYLPIIGVWKIKVRGKGFAYPIPISFCFNKYAELCEKLCGLVKEHNPDVYIDGRISNFIERKKRHEGN